MNISELNEASESKIERARELVDALEDRDVDLAAFKAISSVLDALETMFRTLTQPIVFDPSNFMPPGQPPKKPAGSDTGTPEQKFEQKLESMKEKQYL